MLLEYICCCIPNHKGKYALLPLSITTSCLLMTDFLTLPRYHTLMRESDIRLTSYPLNSPMYRPGQPAPNDQFGPNMYAMPPNYRLPSQFPGHQYPGPPDASLPSGPQSIDASGMMPPPHANAQHFGPQSMQPSYYSSRYSFNPADAQMGPQSYPGPGHEHPQQTPQPHQYSQPSATIPHPHQFAQPPPAINHGPPSLNYVNNGEVAGAQYGQMPAYYGQQPNPADTTVRILLFFRILLLEVCQIHEPCCPAFPSRGEIGVDAEHRDDYTSSTQR